MLLLVPPLARGTLPGPAALALATAFLGAVIGVGDRAWVFRTDRARLDAALTASCRMVRTIPDVTADALHVPLGNTTLTIRIRPLGRRTHQLHFTGAGRRHRKATLLRSVIAKQFEPPLPRIRIRLRRTS